MSTTPALVDATLEMEDTIACLTFNREEVLNTLTGTNLIQDVLDTIAWVNENRAISVLHITAKGKAFSAGGDVKGMQQRSGWFGGNVEGVASGYMDTIQKIPLALETCKVPTICAINGDAVGAGFDFTTMCNIRIASERARFAAAFTNLSLISGDGGSWFLPRVVGEQRAIEITMTGRLVDAKEAKEINLVMETVPHDQLLIRSMELARNIASKPAEVTRKALHLIKMSRRTELPDFLAHTAYIQATLHQTDNHREAVNAFLEKRKPKFT